MVRLGSSIDTPFASSEAAVRWFRNLALDEATLGKIACGNAARLLGLDIDEPAGAVTATRR